MCVTIHKDVAHVTLFDLLKRFRGGDLFAWITFHQKGVDETLSTQIMTKEESDETLSMQINTKENRGARGYIGLSRKNTK